jgi:hypothetical protein
VTIFNKGCFLLMTTAALHSAPASAQTQILCDIRGTITDQQGGVLPGVKVTATPLENRPSLNTVTDDAGFYTLRGLEPGAYTIKAELAHFAKVAEPGVLARAGLTLSLDLVMAQGDTGETITMRRETPMLEVLRPGQAINISGDLQREMPLSRSRDWAQFMEVTPGITGIQTQTFPNYYFHGSSSSSHVFQLDGSDITPSISNSNVYIALNTDAIEDVQVRTAVADASVPLGTGVIANIVSRSGTNTVHGMGSIVYQNRSWNDSNASSGTVGTVSTVQPDLSAGGPIRRDRAWFFGAYRRLHSEYGLSRNGQQLASLAALAPDFSPFDNENSGSISFAKATIHAGSQQFVLATQYDRNALNDGSATDAAPFRPIAVGGPWYMGRASLTLAPSLLAEVAVTYNTKDQSNPITDPSLPSRVVYELVDQSGGGLDGTNLLATLNGPGGSATRPSSKLVISGSLSHLRKTSIGTHDLRAGGYLQRDHDTTVTNFSNHGAYLVEEVLRDASDPSHGTIPFHTVTSSVDHFTKRDLRTRDIAGYLQDLWHPVPRVAIAVGVRVDAVSRRDVLFDRQLQRSVDVGPRGGGTVTLDSESRNILHAAYGRIHEALPTMLISTGSRTATRTDAYDADLDGTFETTFVTPGFTRSTLNKRYDASLHQPFVDEWTAGYRRQLPGHTALDAAWTHRAFRELPTLVEVNGIYDGGVFAGYRDITQNEIGLFTNNRWNWPVYNAIAIQLAKNVERFQVFGSYTRQWRHMAGTWQPNDPASFIQPAAFANARGLDDTTGDVFFPYDSYDPSTPGSSQWHDHVVRVAGTVRLPWAFQVSANYTMESGRWSGPVFTHLAAPDPAFGPPIVELSDGRTVSNPLSTTTRFAYGTRGDGQLSTEALHVLNLRVGRDMAVAGAHVFMYLDVFNVPNAGTDQTFVSLDLTSSSFGAGGSRQLPRAYQVSARVSF